MKGSMIVLGSFHGHEAAALMIDGRLEDLLIDPADALPLAPGAILRATVDRPVKGQGGVFVRLPGGSGFLRETGGLAPGQSLLVQVSGVAEPGKAVPVTTRILFKSRFVIVTPGAPGINISRAIRDADLRDDLTALADQAMAGNPHGLILRSACDGADETEIADDLLALRDLALAVMADDKGGPELLVDAPSPQDQAWREWPEAEVMDDAPGAFDRHDLPDQIAALLRPEVALTGGGSMVIEPTRALIAIDVNTGTDTSPAAALKANISAVRDLPRQLRLRGLGGQVVVDVAPMPKRDRATLEQQLRAALKRESAETTLAGWTPLGHLEIQRKRDRAPLSLVLGGKA
ncbi:ribonuclease E/G [Paracoccus sp. p3-h83]|uniref:ribonuclease E/G n=1 Tax=Paracoccus sp. p3-h83 TaxID=3342805 RepID=UPI0035B99256